MTRAGIALLVVVTAVSMLGSPRLRPGDTLCNPCHPQIGDFNGDGLDDFIGAYVNVHLYYAQNLYLNLGGRFGQPVVASGLEGNLVVEGVGDFNADGLDDVVVMKPGSLIGHPAKFGAQGPHRLKINKGSGKFVDGPALPGYVVQVTDFDADGRADLVLLAYGPSQIQTGLTLARNKGDGTWALHQTLPFPDNKDSTTSPPFAVGDLNSDGRPDLVQQRDTYLHFYFAQPDGQFTPARSRFTHLEPREPHIADVNGDGHVDLVFISWFDRRDGRVTALFGDGTGRFPGVSHLSIPFESSDPENPPVLANLAVADFYAGGANEIAVGVNAGQIMMLSAMGDQLQEVTRLEVPAHHTLVHAGRFRSTPTADLLVDHMLRSSSATALVFTEGAVAPTVRQARVGSRARAVRRTVATKTLSGAYDVRVQSACATNLPGDWTISEEGLFVDVVTGPGLRVEAAMIDGGVNARFFIEDGVRTRTFEGPFESVGTMLKGRFYEYDPPCGGRWSTHDIEALR